MMLGTMPIPTKYSTTVLSGTSIIQKGPQSVSFIKRFFVLCPLFRVSIIGDSAIEKIESAVFFDCRLGAIIEATGASTYHGFLPSLVRDCVASFTLTKGGVATSGLTKGSVATSGTGVSEFPLSFATALFSFLYHLATYEASE